MDRYLLWIDVPMDRCLMDRCPLTPTSSSCQEKLTYADLLRCPSSICSPVLGWRSAMAGQFGKAGAFLEGEQKETGSASELSNFTETVLQGGHWTYSVGHKIVSSELGRYSTWPIYSAAGPSTRQEWTARGQFWQSRWPTRGSSTAEWALGLSEIGAEGQKVQKSTLVTFFLL